MDPHTQASVRDILYCVHFGELRLKIKSDVFIIHNVRELHEHWSFKSLQKEIYLN